MGNMGSTEKAGVIPPFELSEEIISQAIGAVRRAASPDPGRAFYGILIERDGPALRFVATNGHWMAVYTTSLPGDGQWSAIVDQENAVAIAKRAKSTVNGVVVDLEGKKVTFADGAVLPLATIEATYPDWRGVWVKEENKTARAELGVNFRYMADIYESFVAVIGRPSKKEHARGWKGALCIEPSKDLGPMRVTCGESGAALEVILMPAKVPPNDWTIGKAEVSEKKKTA
jgi:hypothetical protein